MGACMSEQERTGSSLLSPLRNFWAVLKDSYREAIDSKVFFVMVALSFLVMVALASVSYQPEPADRGLESILKQFPGRNMMGPGNKPVVSYDIEDFHQLNEGSPPWKGQFQFDLVARDNPAVPNSFRVFVFLTADPEKSRRLMMDMIRKLQHAPPEEQKRYVEEQMAAGVDSVNNEAMEDFVRRHFVGLGALETTQVKAVAVTPSEVRFQVEARARPETYRTWPHIVTVGFGLATIPGDVPLGAIVYLVEQGLIGEVGAGISMLISVIITAFFIPNMLTKGTIDLLLAKPMSRPMLLIYKFVGGLTFMFLNTVVIVMGVWLIVGLHTGLWRPSFLLAIPVLTFEFAIFYSISALASVLTRSVIVSILASCFLWLMLFLFEALRSVLLLYRELMSLPEWVYTTLRTLHFIFPRYKEMDALMSTMLAGDLLGPESTDRRMASEMFPTLNWSESILVTGAFIGLVLALACWRFARRDY
jgi:ABC-type transport system involved in multi-copper enzyme maturation permease subunit